MLRIINIWTFTLHLHLFSIYFIFIIYIYILCYNKYADDTTLMAESEEELKSLLMKVKEESEKVLKIRHSKNEDHDIQSHHFMANTWGNNGTSDRLYFFGLQNRCRWLLQL